MIDFGSDTITGIDTQNDTCLACHSGDAGAGWHAGPHDNGEVACADCHTSHAARDAVLETATQAEVCYDCHPAQRGEMLRAFAHPLLEGKMACSDCHQGHGDAAALQLAQLAPNATCNECHADKRGPFLWEHAPASEDCGLCHAPHGSNHPGLLTRRAPLLCQSCHSQAGHPSIAADSGGLPNAMPSRFLLGQSCLNCHSQVHGSNHPSGSKLAR
jgi:DmsE family decaheme c-type cytochrome